MRWSQFQGTQVVAGLVVYLEGQRNVLKYSQENNRRRQADESPGPSLVRKYGKGGNKEACGYFQETKQNKTLISNLQSKYLVAERKTIFENYINGQELGFETKKKKKCIFTTHRVATIYTLLSVLKLKSITKYVFLMK